MTKPAHLQGVTMPLAADVNAVLAMGGQRFEETSAWPVSAGQFQKIAGLVYQVFDDAKRFAGARERAAVHADIRFLNRILQHAHAAAVEAACRRHGQDVLFPGDAAQYYRPDWSGEARGIERMLSGQNQRFRRARMLRRRYRYNAHLGPLRRTMSLVRGASSWSLGPLGETQRLWMRRTGQAYEFPTYADYAAWFEQKPDHTVKPDRALRDAIVGSMVGLESEMRIEFGATIAGQQIADVWCTRIGVLSGLLDHAQAWPKLPRVVLAGGLAQPLNRIITQAVRVSGGHVVGMQHGHSPGYSTNRDLWDLEFSVVDEFFCRTPGMTASLPEVAAPYARFPGEVPKFTSADSQGYQMLRDQSHPMRERRIRSAMVVGFPAQAMRYTYTRSDFSPPQLHVEMALARILREQGIRVLYGPHPRSAAEMRILLRGKVDEFCEGVFEETEGQADCLVFTHPFTTTFGIALAGRKPLVLVDVEGRDWNTLVINNLRKRVGIAKICSDEHGRMAIEPEAISAALEQAVENASSEEFFSAYYV